MADVEGIDAGPVTAWLRDHVPVLEGEVTFSLITGGHSNLTFRCEDEAGNAYVLRVLESAHDMGREHRIIHALAKSSVPVAPTYGLCQDKSVNGADFYVMGFVEGSVLALAEDTEANVEETDRRPLGMDVINILCELHAVDMDQVGLSDLGRKEAYLERQLKRWNRQWDASKTHEIPAMEESARLLAEDMPEQVGAAIVHGDYRLGNMMVRGQRVQAILDWELCTLGDPLADVGYILNNWVEPGEVDEGGESFPTFAGGFPTKSELCDIYADRTGRDLSRINYYRAFQHWRLAAIGQGVYKRYLVGAMGEDREVDLEAQKNSVSTRAEAALNLLQGG